MRESYTRITEILRVYSDFSAVPVAVLERAADRGTRVHDFCELYARRLLIDEVDNDCKNFVDSFSSWFDSYVSKTVALETRLYSDSLKITGQFDLLAILKGDDEPTLIDIKTPREHRLSWNLQTAAYSMLLKEDKGIEAPKRGCLMLDRNGREAKFVPHEDKRDKILFLKALDLYRYFNGEPLPC